VGVVRVRRRTGNRRWVLPARQGQRRFRVPVLVALAGLVGVAAAACVPPPDPPPPDPPPGPLVSISPAPFPAFQTGVVDYVNRCDPASPTTVQVNAPQGTTVSVNGVPPRSGSFTVNVTQGVGKRFTIAVTTNGTTTTHHVRCLPEDFPTWSSQKTGSPQAAFYATTLADVFSPSYPVVFDTNGVPVWWLPKKSTFLLEPLPNNNFAIAKFTAGGGVEEYDVNGNVVRSLNTVGAGADWHDARRLPNGNYVLATGENRPCNLTSWGLGPLESCLYHVFQELQPPATPGAPPVVVWTWDTSLHIPVTETSPHWRTPADPAFGGGYDPWHYNSIEDTGDGFIISFRHTDAIYKIDKTTGTIVWKLGGSPRPESLQLMNDPHGGIIGQHDARLHADGTVSIYDNGKPGQAQGRPPRAVRYLVNAGDKTATMTEQVSDGGVAESFCCGSARRLPFGNWVMGWGGTPEVTENTPNGGRVFQLSGNFVYRGIPLLSDQFTVEQFRAGMDAQYGT
jgi:hypothetical protein